jgi:hypothetical protein
LYCSVYHQLFLSCALVQVSISSRLLPSQEVQAVKTNIGLVVLTNISIFLFLIQVSITKKGL